MNKLSKGQLTFRAMKRSSLDSFQGMSANEIAEHLKNSGSDFLKSEEWFRLKGLAISVYGNTCMKCKKKSASGVISMSITSSPGSSFLN